MLANSPYTLTIENTLVSFNGTKYGYIPDGGSIYLLSRIIGEIGTFLALTGIEINGGDMRRLNLSEGIIQDENFLKEHLIINLVNRDLSFSLNKSTVGLEKFEEKFSEIQKQNHKQNPNYINDVLTTDGKMKLNYLNDKFKEPYQYPWLRDPHQNTGDFETTPFTHLFNKEFYGENSNELIQNSYRNFRRNYTNTFDNFEKQVLFGILENKHVLSNIEGHFKQINKYFRFNSIKEILECLKENSNVDPFAVQCYEAMKNRSLIAMEVTLTLLRKAKNLDYEECQKMEMNAAKNLITKTKDFENYFENKINKSLDKNNNIKNNKKILNNSIKESEYFVKEYSSDFIKELIENESGIQNIEFELKSNSLLPVKTYKNEFPDAFRLWINEHPRANKTIREFFDYEIKHYMIEKLGIDLRDTRVTINEVRKIISKIYKNEFANNKNKEKTFSLVSDNNFIEEYIKIRKEYCDKLIAEVDSIPKFKSLIKTKTKEIFEKSFKQTCENILHKCKDIRDIDKRRTWQRLRKWIFKNRIMSYKTKNQILQKLRTNSLGEKSLHIPLDESKSWRDEINPEVKKSPFYRLAGLFKLKKISPEYALKFSTTDLNSNRFFEYLEINEKKLSEIREIVKENPKKLIEIFNSALDKDTQILFDTLEEKSLLEYERLYRIRNDGESPIDNMNFVNEYRALKEKWWSYKNNVLEMLRQIILDSVFKIINNPKYFSNSINYNSNQNISPESIKKEDIENSLDEQEFEEYKKLYKLLKVDNNDLKFFGEKTNEKFNAFYEDDTHNLIENIKSSFLNSNEKAFSTIIKNLSNEENKFIQEFSLKTFDLTKSLILHFLLENSSSERTDSNDKRKPVKIEDFNFKDSLEKLFSIENMKIKNNHHANDEAINFLHHIYLKYGTLNVFKTALENTKNTAIEILEQLTENEISNHYNSLFKKVPEKNITKLQAIFQKEKSLLEGLLKTYYEMKINLIKLEIIQIENAQNSNKEIPFEYQSMDYFLSKFQEIAFCEFVLADRGQKCPIGLDLLLKKDYTEPNRIQKKQKQLVELYVTLKENVINSDSQLALSALIKSMKSLEWFPTLDNYSKSTYEGNLSDIIKDFSQYKNLDNHIENFMKKKFREYIYNDKISTSIENVNKDILDNIVDQRLSTEYIENIINNYKKDQTNLNENIYDGGLMTKKSVLSNRNHLNKIKILLTDKINEFLKNYNVDELSRKYMDYEFNSEFHLHRILCNIIEVESFYETNDNVELYNLKNYIEYGEYLLKYKVLIRENKKNLLSLNNSKHSIKNTSLAKLVQLKNMSLKKTAYINKLEELKAFLEAREYYLNKIYNEFYSLFNFSEKYQIKALVNNIQADFAKLYNYIKTNYLTKKKDQTKQFKNFSEFIVSDEVFAGTFGEINFDEFLGLENYDIIKKRIDQINQLKLQEESTFNKADINFITDREIKNIIRNLVIEEVTKSQEFLFTNEKKIDESINLLLEKEKEISENIKLNGFNLKTVQRDLNSSEKNELINEYKLKFKNFYSMNNNLKQADSLSPLLIDNFENEVIKKPYSSVHQSNSNLNNASKFHNTFKSKIESKLYSLQNISKISDNKNERDFPIDLSSPQIDLNRNSLNEFLEKFKDYGLKYNNTIKYMTGDKLSLRDMILNGYDKTMNDYNEHKLNIMFSEKITSELIKTSLEVLDAKLIKAVKIINADLLNKNFKKSNEVLDNLLKIIKLEKAETSTQNRLIKNYLQEFNNHEDFERLENFKNQLENSINRREIIDPALNQEGEKDLKLIRREERRKKEEMFEDLAFDAIKRIYDLKKNSHKSLINIENNNKSVFDLNVDEAVKNEIYETYLERNKANQKQQESISSQNSNKNDDKKQNQLQDDENQEIELSKIENEYINKDDDPLKLTENELKAIYLQKIKDLVDLPNFKNKYSLMKYIYDYYMGSLAVDYDSHFQDAEERLGLLNEAFFLDRIEKTYFNYQNLAKFKEGAGILDNKYYDKLMDKDIFEKITINGEYKKFDFNKSNSIEYFKESLFPFKEDKLIYENLPSEIEMKTLNTYRNFAFDLIKNHHPSRVIFLDSDKKYFQVMKYEIDKFVQNYYYSKMVKDKTKDDIYNNFSSNLLTSTEKFRFEALKIQNRNAEISAMPYNTFSGEVGYSKLLNEENKKINLENKEDQQIDEFIEKTFGNYLNIKKEKIKFLKEKINEIKQNYSHSENMVSLNNPYEMLKLSNQEYIELKTLKSVNENSLSIPDTVNPNSPIKLDLETFLKTSALTKEYPEFNDTDITDIVELDNALSYANFGKYCSIPKWIIDNSDKNYEENYLEKYLEASPEKFIEFAIEEIVEDFYLMRHQIERGLNRDELKAFDLQHLDYFSFDNISHLLKIKLNELVLDIHIKQDEAQYHFNQSNDTDIQKSKIQSNQFYYNHAIKDEDAFYKSVAYRLRLDKIKQDKIKKYFKTTNSKSKKVPKFIKHSLENSDSFEFWYYANMQNERFRENQQENSSFEEIEKRQNKKLFSFINGDSNDENYTSNKRLENAKFLVEYGENNLDKSKKLIFILL